MIYIGCVGFVSFDVVCDELNDCAWYPGMYHLSDKCVIVYCVESFAHIECYSDCSRWGSHLVEPLCYGVVCFVLCRYCRVLCFVSVLSGCVCSYVMKKALLQCLRNYGEEGYWPV